MVAEIGGYSGLLLGVSLLDSLAVLENLVMLFKRLIHSTSNTYNSYRL